MEKKVDDIRRATMMAMLGEETPDVQRRMEDTGDTKENAFLHAVAGTLLAHWRETDDATYFPAKRRY